MKRNQRLENSIYSKTIDAKQANRTRTLTMAATIAAILLRDKQEATGSSSTSPAPSSTSTTAGVPTSCVRAGCIDIVTEQTIEPSVKTTLSISVTKWVNMGKLMMPRTTVYEVVLLDCHTLGCTSVARCGMGTIAPASEVGCEEVKVGVMERVAGFLGRHKKMLAIGVGLGLVWWYRRPLATMVHRHRSRMLGNVENRWASRKGLMREE
jgi:hypothetical protein